MAHQQTGALIREQWSNPSDIFTLLLIVGGEVMRVAIAQLCVGPVPYYTPVSFSFGWVSYSISTLLSVVGSKRLMPKPELDCLVLNANTGYARSNHSWILSRILRDFDKWKDPECDSIEKRYKDQHEEVGLRVSLWEMKAVSRWERGDVVYWMGPIVTIVQITVAALAWGIFGDWMAFLATAAGTVLVFASGALPQWKMEKEGGRMLTAPKDVLITEGNGAHDVLFVRSPRDTLNLEDLASPFRMISCTLTTQLLSFALAMLWVGLLITVAGHEQHTWFLVAIGLVGIIHNLLAAALPRAPSSFGMHLQYQGTIVHRKVLQAIWLLEGARPRAGKALLDVYFPGGLRADEVRKFDYAERRYQSWKKQATTDEASTVLSTLPDWDANIDWDSNGVDASHTSPAESEGTVSQMEPTRKHQTFTPDSEGTNKEGQPPH